MGGKHWHRKISLELIGRTAIPTGNICISVLPTLTKKLLKMLAIIDSIRIVNRSAVF